MGKRKRKSFFLILTFILTTSKQKGECKMNNLTEKQQDIVEDIRHLEKEHDCTIYLKYDDFTSQIHPIKIESIEADKINITRFFAICTRTDETIMKDKGIFVAESIADGLNLCKLNPALLDK